MYYITKTINDNGINKVFLSKRMKTTWQNLGYQFKYNHYLLYNARIRDTENFLLTFHWHVRQNLLAYHSLAITAQQYARSRIEKSGVSNPGNLDIPDIYIHNINIDIICY